MQQPTNASTSNLQIKLITDARKLLEKVRSQQLLSADSSFDSSFLFDPMQDSKEYGVGTHNNNAGGGTVGTAGDNLMKKDSSDEDKKQSKIMTHPPFEFLNDIEVQVVRSTNSKNSSTSSFHVEPRSSVISPPSSPSKNGPKMNNIQNNDYKYEIDEDMDGDAFLLLPVPTSASASAPEQPSFPQSMNQTKLPSVAEHQENNFIGDLRQDYSHNNNGSNNSGSVEKLQEENMKLKRENYHLNEEMSDFEYKLYCLEHTLGIIEDVEKSQKEYDNSDINHGRNNNHDTNNGNTTAKNSTMNQEEEFNPLVSSTTTNTNNEPKDRLSPITAMVADAVISGSGINERFNFTSAGRDGPPSSPTNTNTNNTTTDHKSQAEEIKILRENNEKMVTAIKALAQATISQTRKHYLYKKRHNMTKQMVVEESEKLEKIMMEKEKVQSDYYQTRSQFLKEKDIRQELSEEIRLMAKKNNVLRKEKQKHEDMRMKILDRVEFRDDNASVLSRISDSSCFPILQTITESGQPTSSSMNMKRNSRKDKNVEKLIFKLISQLKKRDAKIDKLEKKLKITMQYLQGALELEVARQDAEVASLSSQKV